MKLCISVIIVMCAMLITAIADTAEVQPGTPNIIFCEDFVKNISKRIPMPYQSLIKLTGGEGIVVAQDSRHWEGISNSYLTVVLHSNLVKGGLVSCPNGDLFTFGDWGVHR